MKKSDFFDLVKSLPAKPDYIAVVNASIFVCKNDEYMNKLLTCKTLENAAKECHKFNRWLSEALEVIHPLETQWSPESEVSGGFSDRCVIFEGCCQETEEERNLIASGDFNRYELFGVDGIKTCHKCHDKKTSNLYKLQPGLHEAKNNAVGIVADKLVHSMDVGGKVISMTSGIKANAGSRFKQKSPEKMFVRATLNIMKRYDCFDSVKNPHWTILNKKQKKDWARKFGIEMLACWIDSCAMDLASDYKSKEDNILMSHMFHLSDVKFYLARKDYWLSEARKQLIDELDYSGVEDYIEENLICLW